MGRLFCFRLGSSVWNRAQGRFARVLRSSCTFSMSAEAFAFRVDVDARLVDHERPGSGELPCLIERALLSQVACDPRLAVG
jgi:hypothetical protein